jgi:hypothetical protein
LKNNPRFVVSWIYRKIFFILFQRCMVGVVLCVASKLTTNAISGLFLFARYMSAPITLWYENSGPNTSSPSSLGPNGCVHFEGTNNYRTFRRIWFFHVKFLQYFMDIRRLLYKNTRCLGGTLSIGYTTFS